MPSSAEPDFVLFKLPTPEGRVTYRGRVTIEGLSFSIDCWVEEATTRQGPGFEYQVGKHFEGTVRKGNPNQKGLFES